MKSTRLKYASTTSYGIPPALVEEGLVVLNMSLEPIGADEGAAAILSLPGSSGEEAILCLPDNIREALGRNHDDLFSAKMSFRIGKDVYNCRAFVMQRQSEEAEPMMALHMQRDTSVPNAIDMVASQYHLTDREQEVLRGIAIGLTSKETAERMNISPNTVKSFLRIIMIKMGAATRSGIVGKLLEYSNTAGPVANGHVNGSGNQDQASMNGM
jgi:DNA-binding CsgD family transcriptional regulator